MKSINPQTPLPRWFNTLKSAVKEWPLRTGERAVCDTKNHATKLLYTIEAKMPGSSDYLPVLLPTGAWYFDTAEERDRIFHALMVSRPMRESITSRIAGHLLIVGDAANTAKTMLATILHDWLIESGENTAIVQCCAPKPNIKPLIAANYTLIFIAETIGDYQGFDYDNIHIRRVITLSENL